MTLRRFRDEQGGELVDLPRAALPDADTPAPVRFLPTWDATLLVHARRTQLLPERFRPLLFDTKTPHSFPCFLIDGQVAGSWKHEGGRVIVSPFEPLPRSARRALDDESGGSPRGSTDAAASTPAEQRLDLGEVDPRVALHEQVPRALERRTWISTGPLERTAEIDQDPRLRDAHPQAFEGGRGLSQRLTARSGSSSSSPSTAEAYALVAGA